MARNKPDRNCLEATCSWLELEEQGWVENICVVMGNAE